MDYPENIDNVPTVFTFFREKSAVNKRQSRQEKFVLIKRKQTADLRERLTGKIKRLLQMFNCCFSHQKHTMMLQHRVLSIYYD